MIIAVTVALGLILLPGRHAGLQTAVGDAAATAVAKTNVIAHAASLFDDGKARHFHYTDADSAITIGITIFVAHVVLGKMPE